MAISPEMEVAPETVKTSLQKAEVVELQQFVVISLRQKTIPCMHVPQCSAVKSYHSNKQFIPTHSLLLQLTKASMANNLSQAYVYSGIRLSHLVYMGTWCSVRTVYSDVVTNIQPIYLTNGLLSAGYY